MVYTLSAYSHPFNLTPLGNNYSFLTDGNVPDSLVVSATDSTALWTVHTVIRRTLTKVGNTYTIEALSGGDVDGGDISISNISYEVGSSEQLRFTIKNLTLGTLESPIVYNFRVSDANDQSTYIYWPASAASAEQPGIGVPLPTPPAETAMEAPSIPYPPDMDEAAITLYWEDSNPDSISYFTYKIFRMVDNGQVGQTFPINGLFPTSLYGTLNGVTFIYSLTIQNWVTPQIRSYTDTSVSGGVAYIYQIRADWNVIGTPTSDIRATPLPGPLTISNLIATEISRNSITLQWVSLGPTFDIGGNYYRIQYEIDGASPGQEVTTQQGTGTIGNGNTNSRVVIPTATNNIFVGATLGIIVQSAPEVIVYTIVQSISSSTIEMSKEIPVPDGSTFTFTNLPSNSRLFPAEEGTVGKVISGLSNVSIYRFRIRGESDQAGAWSSWNPYLSVTGTAQGGSLITIDLANDSSGGDDVYLGRMVEITGGTGVGSFSTIRTYAGASKTASVYGFSVAPASGSTYTIGNYLPVGPPPPPVFSSITHQNNDISLQWQSVDTTYRDSTKNYDIRHGETIAQMFAATQFTTVLDTNQVLIEGTISGLASVQQYFQVRSLSLDDTPGVWGGGTKIISDVKVTNVTNNDITLVQPIGTNLIGTEVLVVFGTGQFSQYYVTQHSGSIITLQPDVNGYISTDSLISARTIDSLNPATAPPFVEFASIDDRGTVTSTAIVLTWVTPATSVANFIIEYQQITPLASNVSWIFPTATTVAANLTSVAFGSPLLVGNRYAFRIRSVGSTGDMSSWSTTFVTGFYGALPGAPQEFILTPAINQIVLTFAGVENEAIMPAGHLVQHYIIERDNVQIAAITRGTLYSYTDTNVVSGTYYAYKLTPVNDMLSTANGNSGYGQTLIRTGTSLAGDPPVLIQPSASNRYCVSTVPELEAIVTALNNGTILENSIIHLRAGTYPLKLTLRKGVNLDTRCAGTAEKVFLTKGIEIYANGSFYLFNNLAISNDSGALVTCLREVGDTSSYTYLSGCTFNGNNLTTPGIEFNGGIHEVRLFKCLFKNIQHESVFETTSMPVSNIEYSKNKSRSVRLNRCSVYNCLGSITCRGSASVQYGGLNSSTTLKSVFITNCSLTGGKGIKLLLCNLVNIQGCTFNNVQKIYYANPLEVGHFNCDENTFKNCELGVQVDSVDTESARGQFISSYMPVFTFNGNRIFNMNTAVVAFDSAHAYRTSTVTATILAINNSYPRS